MRKQADSTSDTHASQPAVPGWWTWLAAFVGGLAGALAFNPIALRPLILLAPLGCFLTIRWSATPRSALLRTWIFGFVYFLGALHWLFTVNHWVEPHVLGILGVLLLVIYLGAFPALIGFILRKWLWTSNAALQFTRFASLWLLSEWLRTLGRLGMPLAQLGHAWATLSIAIQIAPWLGELGLSLEILFGAGICFLIGRAIKIRCSPALADQHEYCLFRRIIPPLVITFLALFIVLYVEMKVWEKRIYAALHAPTTPTLKVGLLQPNISQDLKLTSYNPFIDTNLRLSLQQQIRERTEEILHANAHGHFQLILLPETAYTEEDFNTNKSLRDRIGETVRQAGADMLVSATRMVSENEFYNTAYFVHKDGAFDTQWYDKMHLVPFGENLPYFDKIPGLQTLAGIGTFTEGKTQTLFTSNSHRFGVLICFESTFSSMARALVRKGSSFLTVITNDAWYGRSAGAVNHHNLSLLRAAETRRWLLRCANTGISSIITPAGEIQATLGLGRQGFVQGTITPDVYTGRTLFVCVGNIWLLLPALVIATGIVSQRRFTHMI